MGLTSASTPNTPRLAGREASTTSLARSLSSSLFSLCHQRYQLSKDIVFIVMKYHHQHCHHSPIIVKVIIDHFKNTIQQENNLAGLVRPLQGCDAPADFAQRTCDSRPRVCTPVHQFTRAMCTGNPQTPTSLGQLGPRPSWQAPGGTCDPDSRNVDLIRAEACHQQGPGIRGSSDPKRTLMDPKQDWHKRAFVVA